MVESGAYDGLQYSNSLFLEIEFLLFSELQSSNIQLFLEFGTSIIVHVESAAKSTFFL